MKKTKNLIIVFLKKTGIYRKLIEKSNKKSTHKNALFFAKNIVL